MADPLCKACDDRGWITNSDAESGWETCPCCALGFSKPCPTVADYLALIRAGQD